ncbi:MAG TPA: hypothetical protein VI248_23350 [Kineosporiaceae bacterium]
MSYELTVAELDAESAELLPAREALATFTFTKVNWANVQATNFAFALNGGGQDSSATAVAEQGIFVVQH